MALSFGVLFRVLMDFFDETREREQVSEVSLVAV